MVDIKTNIEKCNEYFKLNFQFVNKISISVSLIDKMTNTADIIGEDYTEALADLSSTKKMIEKTHQDLLCLENLVSCNEDFKARVLSVELQLGNKGFIQERQQERSKLVQSCRLLNKKASDQYEEAQREYKNICDGLDFDSIGVVSEPDVSYRKRRKFDNTYGVRPYSVSTSNLRVQSPLPVDMGDIADQSAGKESIESSS